MPKKEKNNHPKTPLHLDYPDITSAIPPYQPPKLNTVKGCQNSKQKPLSKPYQTHPSNTFNLNYHYYGHQNELSSPIWVNSKLIPSHSPKFCNANKF